MNVDESYEPDWIPTGGGIEVRIERGPEGSMGLYSRVPGSQQQVFLLYLDDTAKTRLTTDLLTFKVEDAAKIIRANLDEAIGELDAALSSMQYDDHSGDLGEGESSREA